MSDPCADALQKASDAYMIASTVNIKHESHEATCARRYQDWKDSTIELKSSIKGIYGILWTTSGVTIVTLIGGISALIYFMLTRTPR